MKVLSYVKGMDGCSYHRIYLPNQQIEENRVVGQLSSWSGATSFTTAAIPWWPWTF
jgi:hypothetical protein